jgi:GTP-dependent phosphoenolpyruvate carboxykinase
MAAGTLQKIYRTKLAGGAKNPDDKVMLTGSFISASGSTQTAIVAVVPGIKATDIVVCQPANASAAACVLTGGTFHVAPTTNTITVTFTSKTLAGTEVFNFIAIQPL